MSTACLNPRRTQHGFPSRNSRRGFFSRARVACQGAGHLNQGTHWGFDGASLENASAFSHDPIAADVNLYRYVGNGPTNYTGPSGMYEANPSKQPGIDPGQLFPEGGTRSKTLDPVKPAPPPLGRLPKYYPDPPPAPKPPKPNETPEELEERLRADAKWWAWKLEEIKRREEAHNRSIREYHESREKQLKEKIKKCKSWCDWRHNARVVLCTLGTEIGTWWLPLPPGPAECFPEKVEQICTELSEEARVMCYDTCEGWYELFPNAS